MIIASPAGETAANPVLIEAGMRSALVTLGQMLPQGPLVLKSQAFIHSSGAARNCLQQLRGDGIEVVLSLSGRISGTFALVLDHRAARQLVAALVGEGMTTPVFNDMAQSALKEAANVGASAFLGALEKLSGSGGLPGLPDLQMDIPCHDQGSAWAENDQLYALPLTLITGINEGRSARGGIFISLNSEHGDSPSPASGRRMPS